MNAIKTKPRNAISLKMLEALVRIKIWVQLTNKCCNIFIPTKNMYELFKSSMYSALHDPQNIGNQSTNNDAELFEETVNFITNEDYNKDCVFSILNMD